MKIIKSNSLKVGKRGGGEGVKVLIDFAKEESVIQSLFVEEGNVEEKYGEEQLIL